MSTSILTIKITLVDVHPDDIKDLKNDVMEFYMGHRLGMDHIEMKVEEK
ncbi:hypothetical protein LCGC14_2488750 [marine sediment metagenome]|uniref:Uncharacterized protein n=1 Tax=marine sediment metagenome TaxID=412755 RepID=A0A0F9DHA2_9ZZZZ